VIKKLVEKIRKCKEQIIEILRMWIAKAKMVPVKIGAGKTIQKSLRQSLINTSRYNEIKEIQNSPNGHCTYFGKC
jgi:hypothetical protein